MIEIFFSFESFKIQQKIGISLYQFVLSMRSPKPGVSVTVKSSRTPFSWMAVKIRQIKDSVRRGKLYDLLFKWREMFVLSDVKERIFVLLLRLKPVWVERISVVLAGSDPETMHAVRGSTEERNKVLMRVDLPNPLRPFQKEREFFTNKMRSKFRCVAFGRNEMDDDGAPWLTHNHYVERESSTEG